MAEAEAEAVAQQPDKDKESSISSSSQQLPPDVTLFRDPLFLRSKQWMVSTSSVPSANPGFGPVVIPDGVGIGYDIKGKHIYFTCTSHKGLAPALSHYLEESLLEMKNIFLFTRRSKL